MTRIEFKLPDIGEGIAEAEIVEWLITAGDAVREGDPLVAIMTDKATIELESPADGIVSECHGAAGDRIAIGSLLATLTGDADEEGEAHATRPAKATPPAPARPAEPARNPPPVAAKIIDQSASRPAVASPAVRTRARGLGVDLATVPARGDHVRHGDLDAFLFNRQGQGYASAVSERNADCPDETVKVIGLRRRIAERMTEAWAKVPHVTLVEEIDVTALEAMRTSLNTAQGDRAALSPLPFIVIAMCRAAAEYPVLNATYDDAAGTVTRHGSVHIGIATQTPGGLMVPVLRDAHRRNLWQLSAGIAAIAEAARDGSITADALSGSTITISSLGKLGGISSTPIINLPEVAILGTGRIIERPAIFDGRIETRQFMNLSASCDHRVVDGHDLASFLAKVRFLMETPALLLAPI